MNDVATAEDIFFEPESVEQAAPEPEEPETEEAAAPQDAPEEAETDADDAAEEASDDAEAENSPEEADETFVVKVDGEEQEVALSELLSGYQRNKDYTQKTQALSQERREWETQRSGEIEQLQAALTYYAVPKSGEPDIADYQGRAEEFVQAHGEWKEQEQRQAQAAQLLEQITAAETARTLAREQDLLIEKVPEWSDPQKYKADMQTLSSAATEHWGFTEAEIQSATDHRMFLMLRDAVKGREVSQKPVVLSRKTAVKPKLGAGSKVKQDAKGKRHASAMAELKKTGEVSDPSALFFDD